MPQARDEAGNIWEVDAQGNPVRLVRPANQPPADPQYQVNNRTVDTQVQQAEADLGRTQVQTRGDVAQATVTEGTAPSTIQTANLPQGMMWNDPNNPEAGMRRISGGLTPAQEQVDAEFAKTYAEMQAGGGSADAMKQIEQLQDALQVLRESDTITGPVIGRMPRFIQQAINPDAINVREQIEEVVQRNLRLILGAQFTQQEGERLIARAFNETQQEGDNITRVERLINQMSSAFAARESAARYYEQNGTLAGWTAPQDAQGSVWDQTFVNTSPAQMSAQTGGNTSTPIPPEMQQEYQSFVLGNIQNMTPESYAQFRRQQDQKFGFASNADYEAEGRRIIDGFKQGGTLNLTIPPIEREMTMGETARNAIVDNPFGAGAANFADMVGIGGVSALAGDQMAALREDRPVASTIGQIGGAVAGTGTIGRLGREIAKRAAPNILGGGARGQFARNLATDMTYGAGYGGVTEGDPLSGAAEAGVGSALGQGVGSAIGRAVGGVKNSPAVQTLVDRGIPLTVGQRLGGTLGRIEERAASIPLVGDMIRNRRIEGMEAFNRAAFDDAGRPIGARVSNIGQEGIEALSDQVSDAYGDSTRGVQVDFDPAFVGDMSVAGSLASKLPDDYLPRFNKMVRNRVWSATDPGFLTGENYQQAIRGIRGARNAAQSAVPGFESEYRDALTAVEDALTGQMMRGGGDNVVSGLQNANAANRNLRTIEDAANRSAGGSVTETPFVFSPSQLQRAGMATQKKFPGARPFADLADAAQSVLPNRIPNSGTADRALQVALPAAIAGGGGIGLAAGGDTQSAGVGASIPTAALILAALGGTRQGQRLINASLNRPASVQRLGGTIRRNAGLFGSGAIPLVMSN